MTEEKNLFEKEDILVNAFFPLSMRNRGFFAALEMVKRGKRKIIDWGFYRWIGVYITTIKNEL